MMILKRWTKADRQMQERIRVIRKEKRMNKRPFQGVSATRGTTEGGQGRIGNPTVLISFFVGIVLHSQLLNIRL
jgi:hypothetical protein